MDLILPRDVCMYFDAVFCIVSGMVQKVHRKISTPMDKVKVKVKGQVSSNWDSRGRIKSLSPKTTPSNSREHHVMSNRL